MTTPRSPRRARRAALLAATGAVALAIAGSGTAIAASSQHPTQTPTPMKASYMFVFSGASATMTPVAGSTGTYTFAMPIKSSKTPVIWFTVRPTRDTGTMPMSNFVGLWSLSGTESFAAIPPNVAIATTNGSSTTTFIAAMSAPSIVSSKAAGGAIVLQATMTALQGQSLAAVQTSSTSFLKRHAKAASSAPAPQSGPTTVFIERSICSKGQCVPTTPGPG